MSDVKDILSEHWHDEGRHVQSYPVCQECVAQLNHHYYQKFLEMLPEEPEENVRAGMPDRAFDDGYDAGYTMAIKDIEAKLKLLRSEDE